MDQASRAQISKRAWIEWIAYNAATGASDEDIVSEIISTGVSRAMATSWVAETKESPIFGAVKHIQADTRKLEDINEVLIDLERGGSNDLTVDRVSDISSEDFYRQYYSRNRPLIISDIVTKWPAFEKWNLDYLDGNYGRNKVSFQYREIYSDHLNALYNSPRTSTLSQYIKHIKSAPDAKNYYMIAQDRLLKRVSFRRLYDDLSFDHAIFPKEKRVRHISLLFGPKGSLTPMHRDRCNVFFAQVFGKKEVKLVSPKYSHKLYHETGFHSEVDFENINFSKFPKMSGVQIISEIIKPGELLFIPVAWWHHVKSLDISITITGSEFKYPNNFSSLSKYYE